MDLSSVIENLDKIISVLKGVEKIADIMKGKYGIIHKTALIEYKGRRGKLVWDYILYNELTFEDEETGQQLSIITRENDKKTEEIYNALVEQYGILAFK